MNKQKSIFEIKECIDAVCGADCAYFDIDGFAIANEIYKANYRKASEVAKEIFEEIDNALHDMAVEYANAGHPEYFAVCEMVHHKVIRPTEKKYTEGEG